MHERDPQSQVNHAHSPYCAPAPVVAPNASPIFALVDGNSFYCSCERVFNPSLINQPVIVLSNNDGCVISRTDEAKAIGIKMGDPLHLIGDIIKRHRVRVSGDSMIGAGIHPDDLLIVDRSKEPKNKSIVLAIVNGDFTVKRYMCRGGKIILKAENPAHADIAIVDGMQFEVVGVCTNVIHNLK